MDFPYQEKARQQGKTAVQANQRIHSVMKAGLSFTTNDAGDTLIFRRHGKPTITYVPRKNRWWVRGEKKSTFGTVEEFIAFINKEDGHE